MRMKLTSVFKKTKKAGEKKSRVKAYKLYRKKLRRKKLYVILLSLAGLLVVAAVTTFLVLWNEGANAQLESQTVLDASGITPQISAFEAPTEKSASISEAVATATPVPTLSPELKGYKVIARLDIEKIGAHLPVLAKTTDAALEVSACYYKGSMPGEDGNMVITGHNYANGAIFGKLDQVAKGDAVMLTSQNGVTQTYTVYRIDHIKPDEPEALDRTKYMRELTLMTCESHGNGRLLVRCCADS